jgi:MFS family permease
VNDEIFLVQTLGCFNDNLFKTAFIIFITYKTLYLNNFKPQSIILMGAAAFILSMLFFSPFCGQLIEKYAKTILIRYCKLFEIVTSLLAILALVLHHPGLMILVIFMLGTGIDQYIPKAFGNKVFQHASFAPS